MGFLDKLKNAGKEAVKGALIMAAKSYGTVLDKSNGLCKVGLGNNNTALVLIKVSKIEQQYTIAEDIKTFTVVEDDIQRNRHSIEIELNNGEKFGILLTVDKNQGSALPTAEERVAAHYANAAEFLYALARHVPTISPETKDWVNGIMRLAGQPQL